jgi:hypothetical protein
MRISNVVRVKIARSGGEGRRRIFGRGWDRIRRRLPGR